MRDPARRQVLAWALYDWANSAFATTVVAGFFPLFFKQEWASALAPTSSTFLLGVGSAATSLFGAFTAPAMGAIADRAGLRKRFLLAQAVPGMALTLVLAFVPHGAFRAALVVYGAAATLWAGANVFYDALLVTVAPKDRLHAVSGLGFGLGYLGGGLLLALDAAFVIAPTRFGLADAAAGARAAFASVAVWWALFSLPLAFGVREPQVPNPLPLRRAVREGLRELASTIREARRLPGLTLFLAAYWLYIDGVDTTMRMAVDYGLAIGLPSNALLMALLLSQLVGFPAAIVFGRLGEKAGAKRGILLGLAVYAGIVLWAVRLERPWEFQALAVAVGLVQGGVQSLSRSLFASLIPPDRSGELFGFYNMLGKLSAVVGPLLVGVTAALSGSSRRSLLAVEVLFLLGGALLTRVKTSP